MISEFLQMMSDVVFDLLNKIFGIFPQMPFDISNLEEQITNNIIYKAIQWMNYFLPVDMMLGTLALWSTAMMAYIGMKLAIKYSERLL